MSTKALIDRIEALPPEKKAEVEKLVDMLASDQSAEGTRVEAKLFSDELLQAINAGREALFRAQGLIDTQAILRDLRDNGGRSA